MAQQVNKLISTAYPNHDDTSRRKGGEKEEEAKGDRYESWKGGKEGCERRSSALETRIVFKYTGIHARVSRYCVA